MCQSPPPLTSTPPMSAVSLAKQINMARLPIPLRLYLFLSTDQSLSSHTPESQCFHNHSHSYPPSTPILPSPSLSPAASSVFVSLADKSLASEEKPFRMNLGRKRRKWKSGQGHLQKLSGWWAGVHAGQGKLGQVVDGGGHV